MFTLSEAIIKGQKKQTIKKEKTSDAAKKLKPVGVYLRKNVRAESKLD
jgi:hypothetical protein